MGKRLIHLEQGMALWNVVTHGEEFHPPGKRWWNDNQTRHPFGLVVVQFVDAGEMVLIAPGRECRVTTNGATLFAYGENSQYGLPPASKLGCRTHWVLLEGEGLIEHANAIRRQFGEVFHFDRDRTVFNAMRELIALAGPRQGRDVLLIASHVHRLVMRLFEFGLRTRYAAQSPVERAIDELLRDPLSAASMKELSQQHDVSREHLTRLFRQRVGRSPGQYLAEARLERALSLLRETHLPISSVAQQSGYHSVHTMARQIRAATGKSPSAVRLDAERRR